MAPIYKFAGTCPALAEPGESEIHTFLFDMAISYVDHGEAQGAGGAPRADVHPLIQYLGLHDVNP